jgi:hypothetical protein
MKSYVSHSDPKVPHGKALSRQESTQAASLQEKSPGRIMDARFPLRASKIPSVLSATSITIHRPIFARKLFALKLFALTNSSHYFGPVVFSAKI